MLSFHNVTARACHCARHRDPIATARGLAGVLALVVANPPSLVGDSTPIAVNVVALLAAVFASDSILAVRRKDIRVD